MAQEPPNGSLAITEIVVDPPEVEQGNPATVTIKLSYSAHPGTKFGQWICLVGVLVYDDQGRLIAGSEEHRKQWEEYKRGVGEIACGADGESGTFTHQLTIPTDGLAPGAHSYRLQIYGDQRTTGAGQPY